MQRLNNKQNGMSVFGISIVLVFVVLVIIIVLKLIPVYIENFTVASALTSLEDSEVSLDKAGIRNRLMKNFQINNIDVVKKEHITIKDIGHGKKQVTIEYEVRLPLMGNIDAVVQFLDSVDVRSE